MRYPQAFLERLRSHFSVSEVVGRRIPLKRHGREFQACCPFHNEKTPSFTVNDEKGFYHCFGCSAHGDAIGFVKEFDRVSYREAIESLAREAGIPLPQLTPEETARMEREATLYDVMEEAAKFFSLQLGQDGGAEARDYLKGRGLSGDTIAQFRIGYAPEGRDATKRALGAKNISEAQLIEAGLLIKTDTGETYDRFRGRVMFPIADGRGRVIAFGGRVLPRLSAQNEKLAKYVNSPETPIFHKGEVLYNLPGARKAAADKQLLAVVEGYMDVIALAQAGLPYAVAPLGTAVTEMHLQRMWRLVHEPVLCLDGDRAGRGAMIRAAELALPHLKPGLGLRFVLLPSKEDPDTYVRKHGARAMESLFETASPLSEALWEHATDTTGFKTPEQKAAAEAMLMQYCGRITDGTVQSHMRAHFKERLWKSRKGDGKAIADKPTVLSSTRRAAARLTDNGRSTLGRLEKQTLAVLLLQPTLLHDHAIEEAFAHIEFSDHTLESLRDALLHHVRTEAAGHPKDILAEKGFAVHALLSDALTHLPKAIATELHTAQLAWAQILGNYHLAVLELECREAEEAMAQDVTEATFERFTRLKAQLEALRHERAFARAVGEEE